MIVTSQQNEDKQRRYIKLESKGVKHQRYDFRSFELALAVRQVVYMKIISFDANNDQKFQQSEIRQFLVSVLHQSQNEILYVVRNVFRYDYNNDGVIEYDELVNFCMEQHFGEIAIQRLHKRKLYQKGAQRIMSEMEFYETIRFALAFVEFLPSESDLRMVFEAVDSDKDGYISYEDYFRFLKQYFGSKSFAAGLVHKTSVLEEMHSSPRDKKGEMNLLKRYSKYQGKGNNSNVAVTINKPNTTINSVANKAINNNTNGNSFSNDQNSTDRKPKNINNPKIELTILSKSSREVKTQISFNEQQQLIAGKIARLVYSQLKLALMFYDSNQQCRLSSDGILLFFKNTLKYIEFAQIQAAKRWGLTKDKSFTYNEASKIVIIQHIYRVFRYPQYEDAHRPLNVYQFGQICERICSIVKNTSIIPKFDGLYQMRCEKIGSISYAETESLLNHIFSIYSPKQ